MFSAQTLLVAPVLAGIAISGTGVQTPDPMVGTRTLNVAKSTTTFKSGTTVVESAGDGLKTTVDIVTSDGTPYHWTWPAQYDGKDNPVIGPSPYGSGLARDRAHASRSAHHQNHHEARWEGDDHADAGVSADGKTPITTTNGKDAKGRPVESTAVHERP